MMNFEEWGNVGIWVNNAKETDFGIYVGRGSILGNPFKIGKDGDRSEVILKYRSWLWKEVAKRSAVMDELERLYEIWSTKGKISLKCFCFPKACHALVIGCYLVWMLKNLIVTKEAS